MIHKGIFWVKDINEINMVCKKIPCNQIGEVIDSADLELNSKHGDNYNHKKTWQLMPKDITEGKTFDYYPRGRVEIRKNKAFVFLSPHLPGETIINRIVEEYDLHEEQGIIEVKVIKDYSRHYKCHIDYEEENNDSI